MDLLSLIISSAVGGTAGSIAKELATLGGKRFVDLVTGGRPEIRKKMEDNTKAYLKILAKRVKKLETGAGREQIKVFETALDQPAIILLSRKALLAAAVSDDPLRREMLAELVAQRLMSSDNSPISLLDSRACDAVSALSSRQLHLLHIINLLQGPAGEEKGSSISRKEYVARINSHFSVLERFENALAGLNFIDPLVLESAGCVNLCFFMPQKINEVFEAAFKLPGVRVPLRDLEKTPWWPVFQVVWEIKVDRWRLTSTGIVVGLVLRSIFSEPATEELS